MPLLLKDDERTRVSQSVIGGPSLGMPVDQMEGDILPQLRAPQERPVPAENGPIGRDSSTDNPDLVRKPRATALIRLRTSRVPHRRFEVLQQFEGVVLEVHEDVFEAQLSDMTNAKNAEEFAELPLSEISTADLPLLVPGCVFYWILGYETRAGGQITRVSEIRLRRSPPWSRRAVEAFRAKARQTSNLLNPDAKSTTRQD